MEASFEFEELRGKNGGLRIDLEKRNVLLFSFFLYIAGGGQSGERTAAPSVFIPRFEQPPPAKAYLRGESRRLIFHVRQWLPVSTMGMDRAYKRGQTKREMPPCFSLFPSQRGEGERERKRGTCPEKMGWYYAFLLAISRRGERWKILVIGRLDTKVGKVNLTSGEW